MKIKQGFVLRKVAGTYVVLPVGQTTVEFNGMLTLNESGAMMWELLEVGTTVDALARKLAAEYNVCFECALKDTYEFVDNLQKAGCIEA